MKKGIDYGMIRDNYSDDPVLIASYLYKHYYYIVEKFFDKNNGEIPKEELEKALIKAISEYVCKDDYNYNPSRYMHNAIKNIEKKYNNKIKKEKKDLLYDEAFSGNNTAKKNVFMNITDRIDKRVNKIYSDYLLYLEENVGRPVDVLISFDDIKQIMYINTWKFIDSYFTEENREKDFSHDLSMYLKILSDRIINKITNYDAPIVDINNVSYDDSYFVNSIENIDVLDRVSLELSDTFRSVLDDLRKGYTYEYAGKNAGVTKARAHQINDSIKQIVKRKNYII